MHNATSYMYKYKNWAITVSFSFIFVFSNKLTLQYLQQMNVKKCPSSMQCGDLNSPPSEHESPYITTRPGRAPSPDTNIYFIEQQ